MRALFILIAFCLTLCSCAGGADREESVSDGAASGETAAAQPGSWQKIPADEAKQMMDDVQDYVLVDVRTKDEYEEAHIEGAVLIPVDVIAQQAEEQLPDKDAVILLYCRSGNRSAKAAGILAELGYTQVFDFGGIGSWPYGTVPGA